MATQRESLLSDDMNLPIGDLLIGGEKYRTEMPVTLAQSVTGWKRGQILIGPVTAAAKYTGTGTIIGVLSRDHEDSTDGTIPTTMYVEGEFNEDALIGLDTAGRAALEALRIFAKRVD
jgi:hypothetical protein